MTGLRNFFLNLLIYICIINKKNFVIRSQIQNIIEITYMAKIDI